MNKLRIQIAPSRESDPLPDHWSRIIIYVEDDANKTVLIDFEWNTYELIYWFKENILYIRDEELDDVRDTENISCASDRNLQEADDEDDARFDYLYDYRSQHGLGFAVRGCRVPPIYFGKRGNCGEVSLCEMSERYKQEWVFPPTLTGLSSRPLGFCL